MMSLSRGGRRSLLGGSGANFPAQDLGTLVAWWDSDDTNSISLSGTDVNSWVTTANSTVQHTAVQSTVALKPAYMFDTTLGRQFLRFDGSAYLDAPDADEFTLGANYAAYIVFRLSTTTDALISHFNVTSPFAGFEFSVGTLTAAIGAGEIGMWNGTSWQGQTGVAINNGAFHIGEWRTSGANVVISTDGRAGTSHTKVTIGNASTPLRIGADVNTTILRYLTGDIAEIIMYKSEISLSSRSLILNYLAQKWGVTLV